MPDPESEDFVNNSDYEAALSPVLESSHAALRSGPAGDVSLGSEMDAQHQKLTGNGEKKDANGLHPSAIGTNGNAHATRDSIATHDYSTSPKTSPKKGQKTGRLDTHTPTSVTVQAPDEARSPRKKPVEAKPRLVISKLTLTNFKSYAGVQEIGPFNASFSAVVGPNGSGKSNVIDSLLFVFGFRASKMRQGKLLELIHNSEGGHRLEFCQVDIHFQHVVDDPFTQGVSSVVPGSDLVISRRATKSNGSQYMINGKASNYTEVTSYLRGQGIDLDHKRFLILQGEVESIAQMKAKAEKENDDGLLEYLEDIIGTTQYKLMISDAITKMNDLNDVCQEKENRFELVEKETHSLEKGKDEALIFLKNEKELIDKKSIKHQLVISENSATMEKNSKKMLAVQTELEQEKEKNKELGEEMRALQKEQLGVRKKVAALNDRIAGLNKECKAYNTQIVAHEEKLKSLANTKKKMEKARDTSSLLLTTSQRDLTNLEASHEQAMTELKALETSLEVEKSKLNDLRLKLTEKTSDIQQQVNELRKQLQPFRDQVEAKDSAMELINSEISMLETQKKRTDVKLQEASKRLSDIKNEGKQKEAELQELEEKLATIIEQTSLGEEQCDNSRRQLDNRKVHLAAARQKLQDAAQALANMQNKNKVLLSLSRLAKAGRINGFHGRLGDLGQIDDKYDVAVSSAKYGLDSIVVDSVVTAQACIEHLRKNKIGHANFICLEKLRKYDLSPIQTPGNPVTVKRLFDLITPNDKKFLPAFFSKLDNTLVASTLQEANAVAYGARRFKVVTLDGKVIDKSGTMSGGGRPSRGAMRLASNTAASDVGYSEEEIEQFKQEVSSLEAKVEELAHELRNMEGNLRKLKDMKPETEFSIQRTQLDIQALLVEKKEVLKTCRALIEERENDKSSEYDKAIGVKRQELAALAKAKSEIRVQMGGSEKRIEEFEKQIMSAGGVELKVQNSTVDSIRQKIDIINQRTSGDVLSMRKMRNEITRHTKTIENSTLELESVVKEVALIEEEHAVKKQAVLDLKSQVEVIEKERSKHEGVLEKLSDELEEKTAEINKMKSAEIELEQRLEKYKGVERKCRQWIDEAQKSLEALIVRDSLPLIDWMSKEEQQEYSSSEITQLDDAQLKTLDLEAVENRISELEAYMSEVRVDVEVLKEYGRKKVELERRRYDLNHAVGERDDIKSRCEELKRKRLDEFMEGFNTISLSLKEMYQMITMGGNAELELVDSLDPFSEGILFSVMPPKKSWKNISNLSGGEKTLSSLALVFALHRYKPTPLYVMDEIDAALDFRNVSIVANYIKERTKNAQFVVISLRNNMFELAQQLVGIYKVNNQTRSISLQNKDMLVQG